MKPDSSTSFRFFIWSILAGNSGELKVSFLGSVLVTLGPKSMKKVQLVLKKVQITSKKDILNFYSEPFKAIVVLAIIEE